MSLPTAVTHDADSLHRFLCANTSSPLQLTHLQRIYEARAPHGRCLTPEEFATVAPLVQEAQSRIESFVGQ